MNKAIFLVLILLVSSFVFAAQGSDNSQTNSNQDDEVGNNVISTNEQTNNAGDVIQFRNTNEVRSMMQEIISQLADKGGFQDISPCGEFEETPHPRVSTLFGAPSVPLHCNFPPLKS